MNAKEKVLNEFLVGVYNDLVKIEEKILIKDAFKDISITDLHAIDAIGYDSAKNMSTVAKDLEITVGTLTTAINGLVKKGYVKRVRSTKDRRVVLISLTEKGQKAFKHHEKFHTRMIKGITKHLTNEEMDVFSKGLNHLSEYFDEEREKLHVSKKK